MRGIVFEEPMMRLPLFQATALVFVSGRNDLCNGGAADNESAPERSCAGNHTANSKPAIDLLDPEMSLGVESRDSSSFYEAVNSWFNPGVIPTMAERVAVPYRRELNDSRAEGTPPEKKPRYNFPYEPSNLSDAALRNEDQSLEDVLSALGGSTTDGPDRHCDLVEPTQCPAPAEITTTAQQYAMSADTGLMDSTSLLSALTQQPLPILEHGEDWANLSAWLEDLSGNPLGNAVITETFDHGDGDAILDQQVTSFAECTHPTHGSTSLDAAAPAQNLIPAPVPPAENYAAQQLSEEWIQGFLLAEIGQENSPGENVQSVCPVSSIAPGTLHTVSEVLQDKDDLLVGALHRATSTSHTTATFDDETNPEQALELSTHSFSTACNSSGGSVEPRQAIENLSGSRRALEERSSLAYDVLQKLLLSPEGAKSVQKFSVKEPKRRTTVNPHMANAPYLSSSWLLERLELYNKVPAYVNELQTAFECYGYENVSIPELARKALDAAYTVKGLGHLHIPNQDLRCASSCAVWAAEIVRDAFFRGRPLRPDLRSYLRNRLKCHNVERLELPMIQGHLGEGTRRSLTNLDNDFRRIQRAMNLKASIIRHPLSFTSFFTDVYTLLRHDCCLRQTFNESSASTKTKKRSKATTCNSTNVDAKSNRVIAILTKYRKLFEIDLAAEVEALLNAAPEQSGPEQFRRAVREGYVPSDILRPKPVNPWEPVNPSEKYTFSAHCLLGSIAALYRRLFETKPTISDLKTTDAETRSDLDTNDVRAKNRSLEQDVVQEYLLQPLPTPNTEGRLTAKEFDPLSAASEALKLWKQDLTPGPQHTPNAYSALPLTRPVAPFGSPRWILAQLVHECGSGEKQWRPNELQFALDLCGFGFVNIKDAFARAVVLAATILAKREVPFNDANELLKLPRTVRGYALAADIIHAALCHAWPQRRDLTEYFTRRLKYEVLPQHKECLKEVMARRAQWHSQMSIRFQSGDKEVATDWSRLRTAKTASVGDVKPDHPLSFDQFWQDIVVITGSCAPVIPAIVSKYKVLFDQDIVEDLRSIQEQAPQICYSDSFVKGIEEGYVPYRYAELLTVPRKRTLMVNNNALVFLGAIVNYYISLVNPAASQEMLTRSDTEPPQKMSVIATLSSNNDLVFETTRPQPEEQRALLMAILRQAPTQKPAIARVLATDPTTLHPVAQYLLGYA
eukprot:Blabericola_migrator_1__2444@NODE_1689_length_3994_cov_10_797046_g1095_i0_p1_GENE_NODE_1689_length_3994_cov_10_797046_g1095_i0NODE_1689_length_3994_cov_10_797046_g1095_i0_p1_ORF_typecomplete_len1192_score179_85_NODE_1689_length_3994_cov_10_797046_g1095_i04013976